MKSLVIYYSYSGNTEKVAKILKDILSQKGEAEMRQLKPLDESDNFFYQCVRAFKGRRALLSDENFNLSEYDLICIGTPVWAFAPTPAINTFLDKCSSLNNKTAVCFMTYGSGTGVKRCVNNIMERLKQKGADKIFNFGIQQSKVFDKAYIESIIEETLGRCAA